MKDENNFPGWAKPREPKDEPTVKSLSDMGYLKKWITRAVGHSGPKQMPGVGSKSS